MHLAILQPQLTITIFKPSGRVFKSVLALFGHLYLWSLLLLLLCDTVVGCSHRQRSSTFKGCDAWLWHGDGVARLPLTRWGKKLGFTEKGKRRSQGSGIFVVWLWFLARTEVLTSTATYLGVMTSFSAAFISSNVTPGRGVFVFIFQPLFCFFKL